MKQRWLLLIAGTIAALGGCISSGTREIRANEHWAPTRISGFELAKDDVLVHSRRLRSPDGQELRVRVGESFQAEGIGSSERWTLTELCEDKATFDVRGQYYYCYDLFARLGIPSQLSRWTAVVRAPDSETAVASTLPPVMLGED